MAVGYRDLSMSATSIGPVKAMTLSLKIHDVAREVDAMLAEGGDEASLRVRLRTLAERFNVRL
jgi:phosphotransferase system, enzyme I, PtsP